MPSLPASPSFQQFADAASVAFPNLSPQQRVIAQFVLERPDDIALGTVATVAEATGVQPSALVRFANVMGFSGFSELQRVFRGRLLERAGTYRERISAMNPAADGAAGDALTLPPLVALGVADLRQLESSVSETALRQAGRVISSARRVHVLAQRRAFPVAAYLVYALSQLELRVQLHAGLGGMLGESLRQIEPEDMLLVISFKNYSSEVVDAAKTAKANGLPVVAITDHALSPLKPSATVCLEIGAGLPAPVRSLVASMCLAQALVVSTGQCLVEPGKRPGKRPGKEPGKEPARKLGEMPRQSRKEAR
ncbi:MAG: MurR/RpiR family transcriptional regulator [Rubrivivax sp.]